MLFLFHFLIQCFSPVLAFLPCQWAHFQSVAVGGVCFSFSYLLVSLPIWLMGFFSPKIQLLSLCFFLLLHQSAGLTLPAPSLALASCVLSLLLFSHCSMTGIFVGEALSGHVHSPFARGVAFLCVKWIYVTNLAESFSWKPFFCRNGFNPQITFLLHFWCFFFCENWSWLFSCTFHFFFSAKVQKGFSCCPLHLPHISLCHLLNWLAFSYLFHSPLTLPFKVAGYFSLLPHSESKWSILLALACF